MQEKESKRFSISLFILLYFFLSEHQQKAAVRRSPAWPWEKPTGMVHTGPQAKVRAAPQAPALCLQISFFMFILPRELWPVLGGPSVLAGVRSPQSPGSTTPGSGACSGSAVSCFEVHSSGRKKHFAFHQIPVFEY